MSGESSARVTSEMVALFRGIPPATIGHVWDQGFADAGIRPIQRRAKIVGPCVTLKLSVGDSTHTRAAVEALAPGDVLVIDQGGDLRQASWGEMTCLAAKVRGAVGVIVDGAITDVVEIDESGLPTFARGVSALVARRKGLDGGVNLPVRCGGVAVAPGDLVVADENGVVFISPDDAMRLYELARAAEDCGPWQREWLAHGGTLVDVGGLNADEIRAKLAALKQRRD